METLTIYTDEELKKIQQIELECLKCIASICEKLNIEYFLIGGTALGAVRHNGFIPWDDDIDIGMTRENYIRFINEAESYLPSKYYLQTPYKDTATPYTYSKVRVSGTIFMEYCNRNNKMHHGIYVDIFPFDNVPDDEEQNKRQFGRYRRLVRLFTFRQIPDVSEKPGNIKEWGYFLFRRLIFCVLQLLPYEVIFTKLNKVATHYNDKETKAIACLNFPIRKTEYILKKDLYPLQKHVFEDAKFYIPCNEDTYLKTHYGNYMELPPAEKRYGHKPYKFSLSNV